MQHLQSSIFVGLKIQGISRFAYLCIISHMAFLFFFPFIFSPGVKAFTNYLTENSMQLQIKFLLAAKPKLQQNYSHAHWLHV